jgi:hypothetical protein
LQRYDLREQGKELQNQGKELRRSNKLSVRATLANIYTQQMVVMEQGGLRKELWAAEIQLHRIAKGDSNEPSTEEDRDEAMETDDYHTYMTNRDNPVFRPSFELWHQRRSELAELSEELSEELKELEGQPKRHTSHSRKL